MLLYYYIIIATKLLYIIFYIIYYIIYNIIFLYIILYYYQIYYIINIIIFVIIFRNDYIRYMDQFFKFIIQIDNLLKLFVLSLPCKKSDLSIRTLRLVHTVPHQSHTSLPVCSIQYVNYLVSQFQLFTHVFVPCRFHHWSRVFRSSKICCCNVQLIRQSHKLVESCVSHCKIFY